MHRIWMVFDARRVLTLQFTFLGVLTVLLHFLMLSTKYSSWLEEGAAPQVTAAADMTQLPPAR